MSQNLGPAVASTRNIQTALVSSSSQEPLALLTTPFSNQPLSATPSWSKLTESLAYSAFATAATSQNVPLATLPGGCIVHGIKIIVRNAFAGPSISTYTLSVGTAANPTQLASAFGVTSAANSTNFQLSSNFIEYDDANPTSIIAQAVCTGANLNAATSGVVDIYALLSVSA